MTPEPTDPDRATSSLPGSRWDRRRFLAIGGGVGATLFAGCTADPTTGDDPGDGTPDGSDDSSTGPANFRLLVSDRPADIGDFDSLEVTFSRARVFPGGDEGADGGDETPTSTTDGDAESTPTESDDGTETEEPTETAEPTETPEATDTAEPTAAAEPTETEDGETEEPTGTESDDDGDAENDDDEEDDGERGFVVFEFDEQPTVDLTQVVGEKAMTITEGRLESGTYQKMELHVAEVEGVVDGEAVEVTVPSEKLQLTKPFEIVPGESVDFVFDINVVKRGNQDSYNLKPVISKSGVVGEDVDEHEEVDPEGEGDDGTEEDPEETQDDPDDGAEGTATDEGPDGTPGDQPDDGEPGDGPGTETEAGA